MPKTPKKNKKPANSGLQAMPDKLAEPGKLPPKIRQEVLRHFGEYRKPEWIAKWLLATHGIDRNAHGLYTSYGSNPRYKEQIAKYRQRFNDSLSDNPLMSKNNLLVIVGEAIEQAREAGDFKGTAALVKQAAEITGAKAPESLQVNHTLNGGMTFDDQVKAYLASAEGPPAGILPEHSSATGSAIDSGEIIDVEPIRTESGS